MIAAIKTENSGEIVLESKPIPQLQEGEVLIKIAYCGVCGSDLHAYNHSKGYEFVRKPIILGHEISGTVVECGDPSLLHLKGERVILESMLYCDQCDNCSNGRKSICENNKVIGLHLDGGMAEFVKTKAKYIKRIPTELSLEIAATSEPMAIAVHAVNKMEDLNERHVVLVQGPGIIGFFVGLLCAEKGAKVYLSGLEKDYDERLSKCEQFNMIPHIAESGLLQEKVDVLFECSGSNAAIQSGFQQLKKGGRAVFVALYEELTTLFLTDLVRNEWPIITSYGCDPKDYDSALSILEKYSDSLKDILSYYSIEDVNQAFQDGLNQKVLKPILKIAID